MNSVTIRFLTLAIVVSVHPNCSANLIPIIATGPNRNIEPLQEIVFNVDLDGSGYVTETLTASQTTNQVAESVVLQSITTTSGLVLDDFSTITPTITNSNFPATANNIEIFTPRTAVNVADSSFLDELAGVHSTGDLLQYIRVDGFGGTDPMWDLNYGGAVFDSDNYLVVEERNGNTTFTVEPLDANGNLIPNSDTLGFQNGSYEWDVGYQNVLDPINDEQTQELSVLSFDLFNTSTPIGGFRVTNTGNADFKFFIGTAVTTPEPSSIILLLMSSVTGIGYRRRRENKA